MAFGMEQALLELKALKLALPESCHRRQIGGQVLRVQKRVDVHLLELLGRISRQLAERPVDPQEVALNFRVDAYERDADRSIFERAAQIRFVVQPRARIV